MLLTRSRPSLYIPAWTALWSVVSACTAPAGNYTHLLVIRLILGIVEVPFFPGATYLLSCWYTRKELALRIAVLYSGLILATAFSGLLAAGIFSGLDGAHGIAGWRWLFIIEGCITAGVTILVVPFLPNWPSAAKWLTTQEKQVIADESKPRISVNG